MPEGDHPLRARALGRLGAALQPAPDPEEAMTMAREAVAMARRLGDSTLLRSVLTAACSALSDVAHPRERRPLNQELVNLATNAGDRVQAHRGHRRLFVDCLGLGDISGADQNLAAFETLAREFRQAQYQWPILMMRALRTFMAGRFAESDALVAETRSIGERVEDSNVFFMIVVNRLYRLRAYEDHTALVAYSKDLEETLGRFKTIPPSLTPMFMASGYARAGELEATRAQIRKLDSMDVVQGWPLALTTLAEPCCLIGDSELAQRLYPLLAPVADQFFCSGFLMILEPPYTQPLGLFAMALGHFDAAVRHLEDALSRSESIGLLPHLARLRYQCALALLGRSWAGDSRKALHLLTQARDLATNLGQTGLLSLLDKQSHIAAK